MLLYGFELARLHLQDHPVSNVWTVAAPYILLYYIVSRFMWSQISSTMYFSLAPWDIWPFLWCALASVRVPWCWPGNEGSHDALICCHLLCSGTLTLTDDACLIDQAQYASCACRCAMVAHDAWFFGMHMFFHKVRAFHCSLRIEVVPGAMHTHAHHRHTS